MRVPCIVTQANGAPVHGLRKDDFVLLENGAPQEVKYLWQELDLPLTVVVLIETCGQPAFVKQYTEITSRFLQRILSKNDQAAIVSVSGQAWLVTDLTDSLDKLRSGAETLKPGLMVGYPCSGKHPTFLSMPNFPCGIAPVWNAVFSSAIWEFGGQPGRKAMLILSDGLDTGSDHGLNEAITACQKTNAAVYSIRYLSPALAQARWQFDENAKWVARGKPDPERLSRETGGIAFDGRTDELPAIFDRIEADLRSVYVLGYTPSRAPGKRGERKIRIKVNRPGLTVRAQQHYYAQ